MRFRGDERGQPVLIGAILLFGILIVAFASYQAFVVPSQNADVEFSHSQQVENEFAVLRSSVINAIESDADRSASLSLGVQYPTRLAALNPPPVSGSVELTEPRNVEIDGDGIDDASTVCNADGGAVTSQSLVYTPRYNEYRSAQSTVYEHTFVTRQFRDGVRYGDQRLVRENDRIDLLLLTGSVSESRTGTLGLDFNGTHRYTHDVSVENPTVTLPSQFDATAWEDEILAGEDVDVTDVGDGRVEIEFDGEYTITCAVTGVNSDPTLEPPKPDSAVQPGDVNRTYTVEWLTDLSNGVEGTSTDAEVQVTDPDGDPIDRATVDFATGERAVADFVGDSQTALTDDDGIAETEVTFGESGETDVFAAAGDGVETERVTVEPREEAAFNRLETYVSEFGGPPNDQHAENVTFEYEISESSDLTFRLFNTTDREEEIGTATADATESGTESIDDIQAAGTRSFPYGVEVEIDNHECLAADLEEDNDESTRLTLENDDWSEC